MVCLQTTSLNITVRNEQPACKQEPTADEFADIRHWQSLSLVTGLILLCWLLLAWVFVLWCSKRQMHMFYIKVLYAEYLLEEADNELRKELRELAKTRAEYKVQAKLIQIRNNVGPINPPAGYERFGTFEQLSDS
ncbi:hypothetical protein AMEX_G14291 [Astyanax mexicanus]|uniref:Uncharacterized protein n=1 Tax=Astyanax mexicanus TaxID=7994 RepID=A0A8T2LKI0_ASTMX|nr:hypothetical protein AMEX_G14291 [Astyanax mexicanus]